MKITGITAQTKNANRVNVSVGGKYRFSLDIFQVGELGIRIGKEYSEEELSALETESQFGKLYARALEYIMMRPHSGREVQDYLYKKTLTQKRFVKPRTGSAGAKSAAPKIIEKPGVPKEVADRVYQRLIDKNYIDDEKFARWWAENRNVRKGSSLRKIGVELRAKGVGGDIIEQVLSEIDRSDENELAKMIAKKRNKYPDDQKLMQYLARQGFSYDDIKAALSGDD